MLACSLFALAAASAGVLVAVSLASVVLDFQFWPPPAGGTWQHSVFRALFRGFVCSLIALTIVTFEPLAGTRAAVQYAVGGVLFVAGFGLALSITLAMGWRNAFGEKRGLFTTGWFARSRNPIYVATWIGLLGWGLIANSLLVASLLAAWALLYLLAPLLEEPWLERAYGQAYRDYKQTVPRFF